MDLKVIQNTSDFTHIALDGRLDVEGEQAIRDELLDVIVARKKPLIVDLEKVTFLGSMGLGLLFQAAKVLATSDAKMVIIKPQPIVQQIMEGSGVVELIKIAKDEKKAMKMIKK